ncbi:MAG: hypothetical protein S4CHLAM102_15120 [Chlamydiia bacterium]|nr:hypothetical protein [Chlamydiia bacterium]
MWLQIFSIALSLFLLMDPIGNTPVYLVVLKGIPRRKQHIVIIREKLIALCIIVIFALVGNSLLRLIDISQPAIMLSGGIILFLIAIKMIFPSANGGLKEYLTTDSEPLIVPLAIPLVAGPSVLAAVIIYSQQIAIFGLLIAIFIAWLASAAILLLSPYLEMALGQKGLTAIEKLMGLILTMIAVEMFLSGIASFTQSHKLISFF